MAIDSVEFTNILKGDVKTAKLIEAILTLGEAVMELTRTPTDDFEGDVRILIAKAFKISSDIFLSSRISKLIGSFTKPFRDEELPITIKGLAINGNELMELGFKGPELGNQLSSIFEAVLRLKIENNKENILKFIKND